MFRHPEERNWDDSMNGPKMSQVGTSQILVFTLFPLRLCDSNDTRKSLKHRGTEITEKHPKVRHGSGLFHQGY